MSVVYFLKTSLHFFDIIRYCEHSGDFSLEDLIHPVCLLGGFMVSLAAVRET